MKMLQSLTVLIGMQFAVPAASFAAVEAYRMNINWMQSSPGLAIGVQSRNVIVERSEGFEESLGRLRIQVVGSLSPTCVSKAVISTESTREFVLFIESNEISYEIRDVPVYLVPQNAVKGCDLR